MYGHPIFDNEHNAGQVTTMHRPVEAARQQVIREGVHPEHGQFEYQYQVPKVQVKPWGPVLTPQSELEMRTSRYAAPSGATVTVVFDKAPEQGRQVKPEDRKITVNGQEMFASAAKVYLGQKYGINL